MSDDLASLFATVRSAQRAELARAGVVDEVAARMANAASATGLASTASTTTPVSTTAVPHPLVLQPRPRLRRATALLSFGAVAGAAAAAAFVLWSGRAEPLSFNVAGAPGAGRAGDVVAADATAPRPVSFSDGSSIVVASNAALRIVALDDRGATAKLERGSAEVAIFHAERTRWQLDAGPFRVFVTGTSFALGWQPGRAAMSLRMREGSVEVDGPGLPGRVVVRGGQSLVARADTATWRIGPAGAADDGLVEAAMNQGSSEATAQQEVDLKPPSADGEASGPRPPQGAALRVKSAIAVRRRGAGRGEGPAAGQASPAGAARWRPLAVAGRYREAVELASAEAGGAGFEAACGALGADDLLLLGDAARLAKDARRAEQAYQAARRRFPGLDRPAFALGLVAFELKRDFPGAARWFERYLADHPRGALADEAAGRTLEAWHRSGRTAEARRAAVLYLERAAAGPYSALARELTIR